MSEPRTEAGRRLAGSDFTNSDEEQAEFVADILAIETEAAALDVERLARAMTKVSYSGGATVKWGDGADSIAAQIAAEVRPARRRSATMTLARARVER